MHKRGRVSIQPKRSISLLNEEKRSCRSKNGTEEKNQIEGGRTKKNMRMSGRQEGNSFSRLQIETCRKRRSADA